MDGMILRNAKFALVLVAGMAPIAFAGPAMNEVSGHARRATTQAEPSQYPVSREQALYLIRSTLLTLNDADRSGNYTVLRDLASPAFQAENTDADLAEDFKDLRRRRIDLFPVALEAPRLTAVPAIDKNGMLQLSGFFPTRPLRVKFALKFQDVSGHWRLFEISVGTPEAPPVKRRTTGRAPTRSQGQGS